MGELVQATEPSQIRRFVHPIVRIAANVADEVTRVAEVEQVDLILTGWHRPAFRSNRLGGRVGQILSTARTDVAIFVDRQQQQLENLLVPYIPNNHTDLGLEIALRLLVNHATCKLMIMRIAQLDQATSELTHEFRMLFDRLPDTVRSRIELPVVEGESPIQAVVKASGTVDLTIVGASREWGLERQTLGRYTDALVTQCHSSLLITRKSQVTPHLTKILTAAGSASSANTPGVGV